MRTVTLFWIFSPEWDAIVVYIFIRFYRITHVLKYNVVYSANIRLQMTHMILPQMIERYVFYKPPNKLSVLCNRSDHTFVTFLCNPSFRLSSTGD